MKIIVQKVCMFSLNHNKFISNTYELLINRRSHDGIVKCANFLIKSNTPRLEKEMKDKGVRTEKGDMYKIRFEKQEEEIEWLVNKIDTLVDTEYYDGHQTRMLNYNDIALFFRSIKYEAAPYIKALQKAGFPLVYSGVGGLFDTLEVKSIIRILEYICECDNNVTYDNYFLKSIMDDYLPNYFSIGFLKFKEEIDILKEYAKKQKRLSLQGLYGLILFFLGISDEIFHDEDYDEPLLYNLGRLSQAISDYEVSREYITYNNIKDFIWFIRLHAENSYDSGNTDAMAGLIDAVQIITMHGTKGLGFPVVFMPGLPKKSFKPDFGATFIDTSKVDLSRFITNEQDERRLFYVALTRAKKFLFVTTYDYKLGNKRRSQHNALFDELDDKYFITRPISDPTKRKPCDIQGMDAEKIYPTNYSELSYYLSCGYDYKLRFIYGFNPELVPALGFGRQVHNIINILHKEYEITKKLPDKKRLQKLIDEHFYMRYASTDVQERLKIGAMKSLEKYINLWQEDFTMSVKTERAFEMEFSSALISGSIDMIKRNNVKDTVLEIIDFKTGKPNNDIAKRYDLQVQLYTIAAKEALGINTEKAFVHYLDDNKNVRVEIPVSPYAIDNAKAEIGLAIDGITKKQFPRDASNNNICKKCDWKNICQKREGYNE